MIIITSTITTSDTPTGKKEEEEAHDEGVSEVEKRADKAFDLQLGGIEVNAVDEEIHRCEPTGQE